MCEREPVRLYALCPPQSPPLTHVASVRVQVLPGHALSGHGGHGGEEHGRGTVDDSPPEGGVGLELRAREACQRCGNVASLHVRVVAQAEDTL